MNLARYTKALVPAIGSLFAVLYGWANTGQWDVPTLRLALVGLAYACVVYLLPNAPVPTPPVQPAPVEPTPPPVVIEPTPPPTPTPPPNGRQGRSRAAAATGYKDPKA